MNIITEVREKIKIGHWYANESGTTEQQDAQIEQAASATNLSDGEILDAIAETGETDAKIVATWAMSNKIGYAVGLNIK